MGRFIELTAGMVMEIFRINVINAEMRTETAIQRNIGFAKEWWLTMSEETDFFFFSAEYHSSNPGEALIHLFKGLNERAENRGRKQLIAGRL